MSSLGEWPVSATRSCPRSLAAPAISHGLAANLQQHGPWFGVAGCDGVRDQLDQGEGLDFQRLWARGCLSSTKYQLPARSLPFVTTLPIC
jgi:hypothetical protein